MYCSKQKVEDATPKVKEFLNKLHGILTLSIYIRIVLESFQLFSISIISEVSQFENEDVSRSFSLFLAILLTIIPAGLFIKSVVNHKQLFEGKGTVDGWFKELYVENKPTLYALFYHVTFMARRLFLAFLLTISSNSSGLINTAWFAS